MDLSTAESILRQTIASHLEKDEHKRKPLLIMGPTHSGKTTLVKAALEKMNYKVLVGSAFELLQNRPFLTSNSIFGKTAYIVKMTSLEKLPTQSLKTLVIYVCIDPYLYGTSDTINGKFQLVDTKKYLTTLTNFGSRFSVEYPESNPRHSVLIDDVDTRNLSVRRRPPWEVLASLTSYQSTYTSRHREIELMPNFVDSLFRNMDLASNVFVFSFISDKLSDMDSFPYIDGSSLHEATIDSCWMVGGLQLKGNEQLNWKGDGRSPFLGKKTRLRLIERNRLLNVPNILNPSSKQLVYVSASEKAAGVTKKHLLTKPVLLTTSKHQQKIPAQPLSAPKKARAAPFCKKCNVLLKGHKCPFKSALPN